MQGLPSVSHYEAIPINGYKIYSERPQPFQIRQSDGQKAFTNSYKKLYWSENERKKYVMFLHSNYSKFEEAIQADKWKVFKRLSKFVETRNPNQCRLFHQKMAKSYGGIRNIIDNQLLYDNQFSLKCEENKSQLNKCSISSINIVPKQLNSDEPQQIEMEEEIGMQVGKKDDLILTGDPNQMPPCPFPKFEGLQSKVPPKEAKEKKNKDRSEEWIECHKYFLAWTSSLQKLMCHR